MEGTNKIIVSCFYAFLPSICIAWWSRPQHPHSSYMPSTGNTDDLALEDHLNLLPSTSTLLHTLSGALVTGHLSSHNKELLGFRFRAD